MNRYFWFTDENGDNIMYDYAGTLTGAIKNAEEYQREYPGCGTIYINEGEDIVACVWEE